MTASTSRPTTSRRRCLRATWKDINERVPPVSFAVHLGDITDTGAEAEFDEAGKILEDLKSPLYPVVGNHDNFRSDDKQAWKKLAGKGLDHLRLRLHGVSFHSD